MPTNDELHRKPIQDDVPPPSVQNDSVMHTGATCPQDSSLVTISGPRGAEWLSGVCPACKRAVYGLAQRVHQPGTFTAPPDEAMVKPLPVGLDPKKPGDLVDCPKCKKSGVVEDGDYVKVCPVCHGEGQTTVTEDAGPAPEGVHDGRL